MENKQARNPYVSRNIGIEQAIGKWIVLLDAGCAPATHWLEKAHTALYEETLDLAAGKFVMDLKGKGFWEKIYSIMYLQNEKNENMGTGFPAGNLFVRKKLFKTLGMFKTIGHSGNDIAWTKRAIESGMRFAVIPGAEVFYEPKGFRTLSFSVFKYGTGSEYSRVNGRSFKDVMRFFLPMQPKNFKSALSYRGLRPKGVLEELKLFSGTYYVKIVFGLGLLKGKILNFLHSKS